MLKLKRLICDSDVWVLRLRVSLFLTCVTAIASALGYLDGVDALALKFLPDNAFEQQARHDSSSFDTVVLGITPDFFEAEFGGHTPINRDRFQSLIKGVLSSYPSAKVIAIDYDLSPNGKTRCVAGDDSSVCRIASIEADQQARFDKFLTRDLKGLLSNRHVAIVLINPLLAPEDSMPDKQGWQGKLAKAGIRFGESALLSQNWFGTIVKQRATRSSADPCSPAEDAGRSLAAVVNDARTCLSDHEQNGPNNPETVENVPSPQHQVALINFGEARKAVFYCPLWEWSDVTENCRRRIEVASSSPDRVTTVFIGSSYGQEDRFRTPLGDQYGVEIHAFSAFSLLHPVAEEDEFPWQTFTFDIFLGLVSAALFEALWKRAAGHPKHSIPRFLSVLVVFVVLFGIAAGGIWSMPFMLSRGMWKNPVLIVFGFFIDSYQAAFDAGARHTRDKREESSKRIRRSMSLLAEFFGTRVEGISLVTCAGLRADHCDAWLQLLKRILIFWGIVAWGGYLVFAG